MNTLYKHVPKLLETGIKRYTAQHIVNQSTAYKSSISLEKLYPQSSLKITTPEKGPSDGREFSGFIPMEQIQITYSKSSGPGGQNVNKVNTKVDLRFHLESASWISDSIKEKLAAKVKTRITADGFVVFRSDLTRSQQLNVADCLEKLRSVIYSASQPDPKPSPDTAEKLRKRYEKATAERLMIKRQRSHTKQNRQDPQSTF